MIEKEYLEFLEELRISGIVHMRGMAPYLKEAYGISLEEAQYHLDYFIENYIELDNEFQWEKREQVQESKIDKLKRMHNVHENYAYYEHLIASSQEDPSWFAETNIARKFVNLTPNKAREILRGFVTNFDLIEAKYFFDMKNEDEAGSQA